MAGLVRARSRFLSAALGDDKMELG